MHYKTLFARVLFLLSLFGIYGPVVYADDWYIPKNPIGKTRDKFDVGVRFQFTGNENGVLDSREVSLIPSVRYSPNDHIDLYAEIPLSTARQDQINGFDLFTYNAHGVGDLFLQLTSKLAGDSDWQLSGVIDLTAPTGRNPYENNVGIGKGYWTTTPGLSLSFVSDPAIIFTYIGYQFGLNRNYTDINTLTTVKVDPGKVMRISAGGSFALNPKLNVSIYTAVDSPEKTKYNNIISEESDDIIVRLGMSVGYRMSKRMGFAMNVVHGLNDSASDYNISAGMNYGF